MLKIQAFKTNDGFIFETEHDAKMHVSKLKNAVLQNMRVALQHHAKISIHEAAKIVEFIDWHKKDIMLQLMNLDNDMTIITPTDNDD